MLQLFWMFIHSKSSPPLLAGMTTKQVGSDHYPSLCPNCWRKLNNRKMCCYSVPHIILASYLQTHNVYFNVGLLNVGVCMSYTGTLNPLDEISKLHLFTWMRCLSSGMITLIRSEVYVMFGWNPMDHCYTCTAFLLDAVGHQLRICLVCDVFGTCHKFQATSFLQNQ